jgi:hypothetical protein
MTRGRINPAWRDKSRYFIKVVREDFTRHFSSWRHDWNVSLSKHWLLMIFLFWFRCRSYWWRLKSANDCPERCNCPISCFSRCHARKSSNLITACECDSIWVIIVRALSVCKEISTSTSVFRNVFRWLFGEMMKVNLIYLVRMLLVLSHFHWTWKGLWRDERKVCFYTSLGRTDDIDLSLWHPCLRRMRVLDDRHKNWMNSQNIDDNQIFLRKGTTCSEDRTFCELGHIRYWWTVQCFCSLALNLCSCDDDHPLKMITRHWTTVDSRSMKVGRLRGRWSSIDVNYRKRLEVERSRRPVTLWIVIGPIRKSMGDNVW